MSKNVFCLRVNQVTLPESMKMKVMNVKIIFEEFGFTTDFPFNELKQFQGCMRAVQTPEFSVKYKKMTEDFAVTILLQTVKNGKKHTFCGTEIKGSWFQPNRVVRDCFPMTFVSNSPSKKGPNNHSKLPFIFVEVHLNENGGKPFEAPLGLMREQFEMMQKSLSGSDSDEEVVKNQFDNSKNDQETKKGEENDQSAEEDNDEEESESASLDQNDVIFDSQKRNEPENIDLTQIEHSSDNFMIAKMNHQMNEIKPDEHFVQKMNTIVNQYEDDDNDKQTNPILDPTYVPPVNSDEAPNAPLNINPSPIPTPPVQNELQNANYVSNEQENIMNNDQIYNVQQDETKEEEEEEEKAEAPVQYQSFVTQPQNENIVSYGPPLHQMQPAPQNITQILPTIPQQSPVTSPFQPSLQQQQSSDSSSSDNENIVNEEEEHKEEEITPVANIQNNQPLPAADSFPSPIPVFDDQVPSPSSSFQQQSASMNSSPIPPVQQENIGTPKQQPTASPEVVNEDQRNIDPSTPLIEQPLNAFDQPHDQINDYEESSSSSDESDAAHDQNQDPAVPETPTTPAQLLLLNQAKPVPAQPAPSSIPGFAEFNPQGAPTNAQSMPNIPKQNPETDFNISNQFSTDTIPDIRELKRQFLAAQKKHEQQQPQQLPQRKLQYFFPTQQQVQSYYVPPKPLSIPLYSKSQTN